MKVCKDVSEFYHLNDKDLTNILLKKFIEFVKNYTLEDLKAEIYEKLHKKKYIESYCPFEVSIDTKKSSWYIKPSHAKFSTYIFVFVKNYILAYHSKIDPNDQCLSLEDFKDNNYNHDNTKKINFKKEYDPSESIDLRLELDRIKEYLENKTKYKGTLLYEDSLLQKIVKTLDKCGNKGCDRKNIISAVSNGQFNEKSMTGIEDVLIQSFLDKIEKRGIIKKDKNMLYYVDKPKRRSLYNLFNYYMSGYRDKEISEEFNMTVAGVGALKRSLRKEISRYYKEKTL